MYVRVTVTQWPVSCAQSNHAACHRTRAGTGDIQITATQAVSLDGAVVVTTPQELALIDVVKGLKMFEDMKVGNEPACA